MCDCDIEQQMEELVSIQCDLRRELRSAQSESEREVLKLALEDIEAKIVELCGVTLEVDA